MMRRAGVIILGILMVIGGSLWLFKDAYGKNIAGAAEDIAVNMVAVKINQSLEKLENGGRLPGCLDCS